MKKLKSPSPTVGCWEKYSPDLAGRIGGVSEAIAIVVLVLDEIAEPEVVHAARRDVVGQQKAVGEIIVLIRATTDEKRPGRVVAARFRGILVEVVIVAEGVEREIIIADLRRQRTAEVLQRRAGPVRSATIGAGGQTARVVARKDTVRSDDHW